MTAVGTSVATMPGSILSTLGDSGTTRSSGAGSSVDGGFEALFSRTIEAADSSAAAGDRMETATTSLDRRAGVDRQRDVVADDRQPTRVDEPADRAADPSDRAARAETTDDLDDTDRPTRPRMAAESNDPSAVAVPLVIVAPLAVQTPAASDVAPSLVPGVVAATSSVDARAAQLGAPTETVAPAVPGAPGATTVPAGTASDPALATDVPAAVGDASPATAESRPASVAEQTLVSLAADAQPTGSDLGAAQQSPTAPVAAAAAAEALSTETLPSTVQPLPVADPAASGAAPTAIAQATAPVAGTTDAGLSAGLDAGLDSVRPTTSPVTTSVDGSSSISGSGSGSGQAAPGTASGTAAPTDPRSATTATPERVTELRRMRDRAALGGVAGGAMSVDLSDEGLGPLTLHALQNATGVHLTLDAADQATRDLLGRQGAALRNELEAGGTTLGSLDIQHSGPGSSGERGAGTPSGRVDRPGAQRSPLAGPAATPLATVRSRPIPSTDGVDLLI